mmetsp:Transcript_86483/g.207133  ORF Transcript_86483/g.207133 Transcript_86483/m.207133 type:complete len:286 (+) Transcript_86483:332-1189(+)
MVLAAGKVHHPVALRGQTPHQAGEALRRVHVSHRLLSQAQLAIVVAAPHPQLPLLGHGRREVLARANLADARHFTWLEDGVIRVLKVIDLLELQLVVGISAAQAPKVALARGKEPPVLCQHNRMLGATGNVADFLLLLKEVHLLGQGAAVPMAQAQGPSAEEAPAPAPGVEDPIVGHTGGVEGTQRHLARPFQLHRANRLRAAAAQLAVLVGAPGVKEIARHYGRVIRSTCCLRDALHMLNQCWRGRDLGRFHLVQQAPLCGTPPPRAAEATLEDQGTPHGAHQV